MIAISTIANSHMNATDALVHLRVNAEIYNGCNRLIYAYGELGEVCSSFSRRAFNQVGIISVVYRE
ncbi:hypothetical protein C4J90_4087 [Pseudomonas sp. R2-60-08W]|nr:hypothetical protein C4J90_4087 [Pseudomonas sp. R2-60-08W]